MPTVAVTVFALVGSYFVQPKYRSSVVVWMGNPIRLSADLERMLGNFRDISGNMRMAVGDARDLTRQITSLPYADQVLRKMRWDTDSGFVASAQTFASAQPGMTQQDAMAIRAAGRLASSVELEVIGTNHVRISIEEGDAFQARDMAKALGEVFVEEKAKEEMRNLFVSIDFSHELLDRYEKQLQDKREERTQLEKDIAKWQSGTNRVTADANRTELSSEIERRRQDVRGLQEEERRLEVALQKLADDNFRIAESTLLKQRRQEVSSLLTSFADLLKDQPWKDPSVVNQALRLARFEDDIEAEQRQLVSVHYQDFDQGTRRQIGQLLSVRERVGMVNRLIVVLSDALSQLEKRVLSAPEYRAKLDELAREVERAELLRDQFRQQQISYEISQDLVQESRFLVVEDARVEPTPVWPDRLVIVLAGLVAGLFLGGGALFAVEYSDRSLKNVADAEAYVELPVVGLVPKVRRMSGKA